MNNQEKLQILKEKQHSLEVSTKENYGVQRKVRREIRNLEKKMAANG